METKPPTWLSQTQSTSSIGWTSSRPLSGLPISGTSSISLSHRSLVRSSKVHLPFQMLNTSMWPKKLYNTWMPGSLEISSFHYWINTRSLRTRMDSSAPAKTYSRKKRSARCIKSYSRSMALTLKHHWWVWTLKLGHSSSHCLMRAIFRWKLIRFSNRLAQTIVGGWELMIYWHSVLTSSRLCLKVALTKMLYIFNKGLNYMILCKGAGSQQGNRFNTQNNGVSIPGRWLTLICWTTMLRRLWIVAI